MLAPSAVITNDIFSVAEQPDVVQMGSLQTTVLNTTSTSHSAQNTNFNFSVPNNAVFDRQFYLRVSGLYIELQSSANNTTVNRNQLNFATLSAWPLNRSMASLSVQLNNQTSAVNPSLYTDALSNFYDDNYIKEHGSLFPALPDSFNNLNVQAGKTGVADTSHINGYKNPFNASSPLSRASFKVDEIKVIQAAASDKIEKIRLYLSVTEPLLHPWLSVADSQRKTLKLLRNIAVNINWSNSLAAAFTVFTAGIKDSGNGACVLNSCGLDMDTAYSHKSEAQLLLNQYMLPVELPKTVAHDYMDIVVQQYNIPGMAGATGTTTTSSITTNVYQPAVVPSQIYIFATRSTPINDTASPQCFANITSLNIKTDLSNNFNSYLPEQLFDISSRNGLNMSYNEFSYRKGSIIKLDLGAGDLERLIPGANRSCSFTYTVGLSNTSYDTSIGEGATSKAYAVQNSSWTLYVMYMTPAKLITDGTSAYVSSGFSAESIKHLLTSAPIAIDTPTGGRLRHMRGAGFFDSIWNVAKRVLPVVSTLSALSPHPAAQNVSKITGTIGNALNSGGSGGSIHLHG